MDKWQPSFIDPKEIKSKYDENYDNFEATAEKGEKEKTYFEWSKMTVERLLGIKLTNIELVGLRTITVSLLKEVQEGEEKK